ncbi:hypothetical protein TVAG_498990 [Trichomonas vaginalis G3]|uniref:Uncharacterized protein n=1 Tax=Trichomonas vaginalis (strain ATCC PRA-98 / G3) TaxID=412133 RepID=A2FCK4_TRIV3|nr:hypothetical protein TVAGG3_0801310 [Trichomonas vaginalis G3]EAX97363.1 hypothetical protein TVAG_498990 [Trichomonas vaginalis G3]KAI5496523.1 hypothetical protein TVAGG3_0801310 [Trichomonas vaginalis G3]|eukprot:XP_001310293.1 hypothetical protein [Trichomonas vaginalis G3]
MLVFNLRPLRIISIWRDIMIPSVTALSWCPLWDSCGNFIPIVCTKLSYKILELPVLLFCESISMDFLVWHLLFGSVH